ncbi:Metallo-dependent phosphatase [Xylaria sp. FL1042]|nr:Metallo-dependent phosphatase [Xylaria sp. FL1042]
MSVKVKRIKINPTTVLRTAFPFLTLAIANLGLAGDTLYSKRMTKRFLDDAGNYNISFYHINDVHAHLDQFSSSGTDCASLEKGCYGGYARVKTMLEETRPEHPDSLVLNVGDEFQGTLFINFYGGEKIADTLNHIGFDAMTVGNHEWDRGDDYLGEFLDNLTFPIVSANIVSDNKQLNSTIKPYHIFEKYGLAIIGATTETVPSISNPGKGTQFTGVVAAVQASIDKIRSTTNITRIAAITHIGYDEDKRLAQETTGLQLIMGGHSHTLLGDVEGAEGPYPTIETNKDGDEVFIVTAYRWGEYLDEGLQAQIEDWRGPFEEFAAEEIGESKIVLDQTTCQKKACTLGDLISDAMLQYRLKSGSTAVFALANAGGIRATIDSGPITRGEVLASFPFSNAVVEAPFTGSQLWTLFEGIVSGVNQDNRKAVTSFAQVSAGVRIMYDPSNDIGSRLVSLEIGGEDVDLEASYTLVTVDFIAGGGDNFIEPLQNFVVLDTLDEVLVAYIKEHSPIDFELDGRIAVVDGTSSHDPIPADTTPPPSTMPSGAGSMAVGLEVALLAWTALLAVVVT